MKHFKSPVCLGALLMMLVLSGCNGKIEPGHTPAKEGRLIRAPIAVVKTFSLTEPYEAVATVTARVHATVSSKIMGTVLEVRVEEGDRVKKGDVLVRIDDRQVTARLEQARAALDEARRGVASAESARDAARVAAELAETTYHRYERLLKEQSATQQEFDEVEARHRRAQAALAQAEAGLAGVKNRVKQAEAAVKAAAVSKKDAVVRAPYDGRITRKWIHAGDLAAPGLPLITLEKEGRYRAELRLPERHMRDIHPGQRVTVSVPALGAVSLKGVIGRITPSADARSRSFLVKVDLPEEAALRSGMFARVLIPLKGSGRVVIPQKALVRQGQLSGVYVLEEGNVARFRLIRTGKTLDDRIEILSGLKPGMRYVAVPPPTLEDGMKVENVS